MTAPKKQSDFNPEDLIATSAEHEKSLGEINKLIRNLDKRIGTDAQLAESFKKAFENDKRMDATLKELIKTLILSDESIKKSIESAVKKVDKEWWNGAWKKILTAVGAVVLLILGALIGVWIKPY